MTNEDDLTRRRFLKTTGLGLGSLALGCSPVPKERSLKDGPKAPNDGGLTSTRRNDAGRPLNAPNDAGHREMSPNDAGHREMSPNDAGDAVGVASDAGQPETNTNDAGNDAPMECHQTGADIEGPFYRPNVPIRNELDLYGDAGTRLALSGRVLDLSCNPIPNAVVDIWHAAPTAVAVQDLQVSDAVDYDNSSSEMRYRGQTATDAQGRYIFHTKKPGWYRNAGTFRPMHIHVKVWVGDALKLTTQLYFVGDPYMANDPWASLNRAVTLTPDGPGAEKGTFNFVLGT